MAGQAGVEGAAEALVLGLGRRVDEHTLGVVELATHGDLAALDAVARLLADEAGVHACDRGGGCEGGARIGCAVGGWGGGGHSHLFCILRT